MKRIKIGDVFEIETPKGKGYLQYVYHNKTLGELIRVLPGLYCGLPQDLPNIVNAKELYFIHFPLRAAYKQKIVSLVENYSLPSGLQLPLPKMRTDFVDRNGKLVCWHIIDYNTWKRESVVALTEEQKKLSPWDVWNDTYLIERMVEGWTLDKWV